MIAFCSLLIIAVFQTIFCAKFLYHSTSFVNKTQNNNQFKYDQFLTKPQISYLLFTINNISWPIYTIFYYIPIINQKKVKKKLRHLFEQNFWGNTIYTHAICLLKIQRVFWLIKQFTRIVQHIRYSNTLLYIDCVTMYSNIFWLLFTFIKLIQSIDCFYSRKKKKKFSNGLLSKDIDLLCILFYILRKLR